MNLLMPFVLSAITQELSSQKKTYKFLGGIVGIGAAGNSIYKACYNKNTSLYLLNTYIS